jgi:hypothetical protein
MDRPRRLVGEVINFRGILYAPAMRYEVYPLFMTIAADLQMRAEPIRPPFARGIVQRRSADGWQRLQVIFAVDSRDLQQQLVTPTAVDLAICWRHTWLDCPIEVLALYPRVHAAATPSIPSPPPASREVVAPRANTSPTLEAYLAQRSPKTQELFLRFHQEVCAIAPEV